MMPEFIMIGSMSIPAIFPGFASSSLATAGRSLKPTTSVRSVITFGIPGLAGRADLVGVRADRHLHRVVVTVVAALDLDDRVTAGDGAHEVNRVHRDLGAGVAEAPLRQAEPDGKLLGDDERVWRRLGEVRAETDLAADGRHDRRMAVPSQRRAVSSGQVDVLVAVHVVDLGALAVAEPDRLRAGALPAGGHAAGQRMTGPAGHPARFRLPPDEDFLLLVDDVPKVDRGLGPRACGRPDRRDLVGGHCVLLTRLTECSV